jgi:hypothetical protein
VIVVARDLMRHASLAVLVASLLLAAAPFGGCRQQSAPAVVDPEVEDPGGYIEQTYRGRRYVVSSVVSRDRLLAGKFPTTLPSANGPRGERVYFEVGAPGLSERLMAEYQRRHPRR